MPDIPSDRESKKEPPDKTTTAAVSAPPPAWFKEAAKNTNDETTEENAITAEKNYYGTNGGTGTLGVCTLPGLWEHTQRSANGYPGSHQQCYCYDLDNNGGRQFAHLPYQSLQFAWA